jgi:hypothetical protein
LNATNKRRRPYLSYLLRLWPAEGDEGSAWRASLESPHTGERRGFASLEDLCAFLRRNTEERAEAGTTGQQGQGE